MILELATPYEMIETLVDTIEKTRKKKRLRQKDLCLKSGVALSTYQKFIHQKNISLVSLIKIMYALNMMNNLENLIEYQEILTLDEIRKKQKEESIPQRIRKNSDD